MFQVADGSTISISTVGDLHLVTTVRSDRNKYTSTELVVPNVFFVPGLSSTLLSVFRLVEAGHHVVFDSASWQVTRGKTRRPVLMAVPRDGIYDVVTPRSTLPTLAAAVVATTTRPLRKESLENLHRRLGHLNYKRCRAVAHQLGVHIVRGSDAPPCLECALAKVTDAPAPRKRSSTQAAADRVCHIDLAGPVEKAYDGSTYFLVAVWRGYIRVYGLKTKDEADVRVADFLAFVERQSAVPPNGLQVLRTDGGGEFQTRDFRDLVATNGPRHQRSVRYRSSQNGVAERVIRTVSEMACAMLLGSKLPHYLWLDALRHATYILNRIPRPGTTLMPHERLFAVQPELRRVPVFGQSVVIRVPEPVRRKRFRFDGRGELGAFIGLNETIKGYRVYVPGDTQRIRESAGVIALDRMLHDDVVLPDDGTPPPPADGGGEDGYESINNEEIEAHYDEPAQLSHRTRRTPAEAQDVADFMRSTHFSREEVEAINGSASLTDRRRSERIQARDLSAAFLCLAEVIREPLNMAEARRSPQWPEWERAVHVEIKALEDNDTFELVRLPPGTRALDNTVQFRLKLAADGSIEKFKARVCARGDRQVYLLDYIETHAPVIDLVCVKVFFAFVVKFDMAMRQGDVPAAYLKAPLVETVYVKQVKGFEKAEHEGKVWRLKKALYGLRQAGRQWHQEIDGFLR
ncbi:hypothetical protein PF005_g14085 [Phytophthora fragariae]|uniref:Integrase catalytic domain-containing protein n=1 Tax=Phytophthora fragariae TaxID=53985 RepID=A0A6A3EPQ3_9STRA|nr:hypothetical protein PF003_g39328 [Phytophthora fragariae]KAE8935452.1 hypothetical protein PF009_g14606 [Phytophthora fragariae]KAE9103487.1 hypothetical protein PF007_g14391 [Phytophthora fragariae]KAE9126500.1 hypothetical protein PF006_g16710 [Phytophthora fragariae]KAE9203680.1 hypothetical protein PF005_g14085 [Phytophthora fragariae]